MIIGNPGYKHKIGEIRTQILIDLGLEVEVEVEVIQRKYYSMFFKTLLERF